MKTFRIPFRSLWAIALIFALACSTAKPKGVPLQPLHAATGKEALQQLGARRSAFHGMQSLMKVRATTGGKTQNFRAALTIENPSRMSLTVYTPVGTAALTLEAVGDRLKMNNRLEGREWEGEAAELGRSFGILGTTLHPAEMAMLIVGLPPRDGLEVEASAGGLTRARVDDVEIAYAPASWPAKNVLVTRGADRIEIEHLEVVE